MPFHLAHVCVVLHVCAVLMVLVPAATAQPSAAPADTLRSYDLAEIVVSTGEAEMPVTATTMQRVRLADIARQDAAAAADVVGLIPAAHVQTNSRGESLVYLRNAGERQVALFFDGALLNVPWDHRLDLSLLPAGVIGGMSVSKGVPSVLYGTNVLGGAINVTSRALQRPGELTEISVGAGAPTSGRASVTHVRRGARSGFVAAAGYAGAVGRALPRDAALTYSQADHAIRTNSDRSLVNVFGRGTLRHRTGAEVGLTLLHVDGDKGVAPEGHLNPAVDRVRLWRFPVWRNTMLIANGRTPVGSALRLRGTVWGTRFAQAIEQYASPSYDDVTVRQEGTDHVLGTRVVLAAPAGAGAFQLALNALTAVHDQREAETSGGHFDAAPTLRYQQHVVSAGAEYTWRPAGSTRLTVGASADGVVMPQTGDKPGRDGFRDYGATLGIVQVLESGWHLKASAGRKVRFPTMRELFGEALRRFAVNPDLAPETSLLAEAGLAHRSAGASAEAVIFHQRTFDTIDQRTLEDGRRQRINLDGSRVVGVEVVGRASPVPRLSLDGHLTWMRARGLAADGTRPLAEKPSLLGRLAATYNTRGGWSFALEPVVTGRAYSMDRDGAFVALPRAVVLDVRLAYRYYRSAAPSFFVEAFVRADNVTDRTVLPQLGLPSPGRELQVGLNVTV